jgi:hypothetical protein
MSAMKSLSQTSSFAQTWAKLPVRPPSPTLLARTHHPAGNSNCSCEVPHIHILAVATAVLAVNGLKMLRLVFRGLF